MNAHRTPRVAVTLAVGLLLAMVASPVVADESALDKVEGLARVVEDPGATWLARWRAYREAKDAIEASEGDAKEAAEARYGEIQAQVADALRRDNLPVTGWLMGFFGASLLWGGLAVCIGIARKAGRRPRAASPPDASPTAAED